MELSMGTEFSKKTRIWHWEKKSIAWNVTGLKNDTKIAILLIHGFGACKEHWRYNQAFLGKEVICYSIDLVGFGESSQPKARLKGEDPINEDFIYGFESWSRQIADFCIEVIKIPVILIGNSIGGVIALRASELIIERSKSVVLIDCAQRAMDDKRLAEQAIWMKWIRPYLKYLVRRKWLSTSLFKSAAKCSVIKKILKQAYPSGNNINDELINLLYLPTQREGASEAFRGFINLFDDYLAPEILGRINLPVYLIWGEKDPWEPLKEAIKWESEFECIKSLDIIESAGHCPHDESPEKVNHLLHKIIQQAT